MSSKRLSIGQIAAQTSHAASVRRLDGITLRRDSHRDRGQRGTVVLPAVLFPWFELSVQPRPRTRSFAVLQLHLPEMVERATRAVAQAGITNIMTGEDETIEDRFRALRLLTLGRHFCPEPNPAADIVQQGFQVGIIDLTDGEPTPLSPGPEVRLEEARQAAEVLGIHTRVTLDLPNRRLFDCFEARVALAKEFRKYRPKVVIGFGDKTPQASPDHWQAMQITDAGIFYSQLTKWPEHFDDLPVHKITTQLYFSNIKKPIEASKAKYRTLNTRYQ